MNWEVRPKKRHEGIGPLLRSGEAWCTHHACPRSYTGGGCNITKETGNKLCFPWYQNRIQELEAELDKKEAIARIEAGKKPVVLGPDSMPENLESIQDCIVRMNKDECANPTFAGNGGDLVHCEECAFAPKEVDGG